MSVHACMLLLCLPRYVGWGPWLPLMPQATACADDTVGAEFMGSTATSLTGSYSLNVNYKNVSHGVGCGEELIEGYEAGSCMGRAGLGSWTGLGGWTGLGWVELGWHLRLV